MSTLTKPINSIVACDLNNVIGHGPNMPGWNMTDDYSLNFVVKTMGCPVIMGRITAESLKKPLKGRTNIVLTTDLDFKLEGFIVVHDFDIALQIAQEASGDTIWIIGGGQIYKLATEKATITEVHMTKINSWYPGENEIFFEGFKVADYYLDESRSLSFNKRAPGTNGEKDRGNTDDAIVLVYVRNVA